MAEPTITCPHCSQVFALSQSLASSLVAQERESLRAQWQREQQAQWQGKESELKALQETLAQNNKKLAQAQSDQEAALKAQREAEALKRETALEIQKGIQAALLGERERLQTQMQSEFKLKSTEMEMKLEQARKEAEALKQRLEQGSQQAQGEALELNLETQLREAFRDDHFAAVEKGVGGADLQQEVFSSSGARCGSILWEFKRTKAFSAQWLDKLKEDQRRSGAEIAVLASATLPTEIAAGSFGYRSGVMVSSLSAVVPLATVLRFALLRAERERQAASGQATLAEEIYRYVTSEAFRRLIEAQIERFAAMRRTLDAERLVMSKHWKEREQHINALNGHIGELWGALQAIAGGALPKIDRLELPSLLANPGDHHAAPH